MNIDFELYDFFCTRDLSHSMVDITYLSTLEGFCYLVLITDVYSRKIVGWDLSQSLAIEKAVKDPLKWP